LFKKNRNNRHSSAFKRLKENDFSVTIDTGNAHSNYFHPIFNRIPTPREAARIQSFKDNFEFIGSRTSQYRQIGNAVPPLLAKEIAHTFKKIIFDK
jgi:DNA (cytosine-5)-methyltransferase 1